jgi:hypothetical protein
MKIKIFKLIINYDLANNIVLPFWLIWNVVVDTKGDKWLKPRQTFSGNYRSLYCRSETVEKEHNQNNG